MGSTTYQQRPANLYFAGRLELDSDIEEYYVDIDGTQHTFDIVVEPLPEQQEPLLSPALPKVIPETYSNEILKSIFGSAMTGQSSTLELFDSPKTEHEVSKDLLLRFSAMKLQCSTLPEVPKSTSTSVVTSSASHSESESSDFFDSSFEDEKSWSDYSEGSEDRGMVTFEEDSDEDELLKDIRKLSGQRPTFFQ